jgi:hypothetical protein
MMPRQAERKSGVWAWGKMFQIEKRNKKAAGSKKGKVSKFSGIHFVLL